MKYLFIYEHLDQGGIETLIVRMSNWLVKNDHDVILYLERGGELEELLDSKVTTIIRGKQFKYIFNPQKISHIINNVSIDCIYTFGPKASFIGGSIYSSLDNKNSINFFSGIYHPKEFNIYGKFTLRSIFHRNFFKKYLKLYTQVFMSKEVKLGIEDSIKFGFENSIIWPLAINIPKNTFTGKPKTFKIVSIGRYVEFKSYNLYMFDVFKTLVNRGMKITWEIYGDGPLKEKMLKLASNSEFENRIKVNGEVPYSRIPAVIQDASVFIGMGTTILEVGSYGVPTIPAIAYSKMPFTYGYLHDLPYYSLGERLESDPVVPIADLISELYHSTENYFEEFRNKTKKYVSEYSVDTLMSNFIHFTSKEDFRSKVDKYPNHLSLLYFYISYYAYYRQKLAIRKNYSLAKSTIVILWEKLHSKIK